MNSHAYSDTQPRGRYLISLCIASLGIVYGDIGTSPLYAIRECFRGEHGVGLTHDNILGVLSLIVWSLTIVISIKYLLYVMRAENRGEGGILALMALATNAGKGERAAKGTIVLLGLFGAALLYGDGMITPAISVLSAVEGLEIAAPALQSYVVTITICILVGLFFIQKRGTAKVGAVFGPVTLVWFAILTVLGISQIVRRPEVLLALSPSYGFLFLLRNHIHGFLVLGAVFLVVTGGEALYADMGHFGSRPIRLTWFALVLPALIINYFGQGALLLSNPKAIANPFYQMAPAWALYPLIILSTFATIIASQAVISGAFSLTRQAAMLGYFPRVLIQHTSDKEIGQIYVPMVNWILMFATIGLVLGFKSSSNLAAAYGIAVTTTMLITTVLANIVARRLWHWNPYTALGITLLFLVLDVSFFGANLIKVEQGGWFPLLVAASVFVVMTTWKRGRELLSERIRSQTVPLSDFFEVMRIKHPSRVPGAAVFMTSNREGTPPALMQNFEHNHIVHEEVILLTVVTEEVARVTSEERVEAEYLQEGFVRVIAHYGFAENPNIVALILREDTPTPPIQYTTFFLGRETVVPEGRYGMSRWRERLFAVMTRNALGATTFFNLPPDRVIELGSQIEL